MINYILILFRSRSSKNSFFSVIDVLITPILMLIVTPIFLRYLGINSYALWILINSIISSLALFNFAGTDVLIKYVSSAREKNDSLHIKQTLSTIFAFQVFISLLIYSLFILISVYQSQTFTHNLPIYEILYIAIPLFFVKQFEQLTYAFLKAHEQFKQVATFSALSKTTFFFIQSIVAISTGSLYEVFKYAFIASTAVFMFEIFYIKYKYINAIFLREASLERFKSFLNFGSWNWLASITSIITVHSDKWIVSSIMGLTVFGYYSIGILIFNQLHTIVAASVSWIFPKISKKGFQSTNITNIFYRLTLFVAIASLMISIILLHLDFVFELWLGKLTYVKSKVYIDIFLIIFPVYTLTIVSYYYLLALGLVKDKFFVDILVVGIKILVIYFVLSLFPLKQWPLAFLIFISIQIVFYNKVLCRYLDLKYQYMLFLLFIQVVIVFVRLYLL